MSESSKEMVARDVEAIGRIDAVPALLRLVCEATGMRFAAVARVTGTTWTACAVQDEIDFGLKPGGELELASTLCKEVRELNEPIVINHASQDPVYRTHHTPKIYGIESYISVPIGLPDGSHFGTLCAIDPRPARLTGHTVTLFNLFAELIGLHLENNRRRDLETAALLDERATSELREEFIAVLGHDLRTPLGAIAASGHYLELKSGGDPDIAGVATTIRNSVRRMSSLIDDVLDFARGRLGSGMHVATARVTDIDLALGAVAHELRASHPRRTIATSIAIDRDLYCDRERIQQLASNLLGNALTHGAPESTVILRATTRNDEFLIEVWNEGEAIAPESLERIFQPFWRRSVSAHREGLGLGLYICAQIVRAHNGELQVTSTHSAGTCFSARMPIAVPPAAA